MALIARVAPGGLVAIYDMRDWTLKGTVAVPNDSPRCLAFGSNGVLAVGTAGGKIAFFDAKSQNLIRTINAYEPFPATLGVEALAYSPDGQKIISGSGSTSGSHQEPNGTSTSAWPTEPIRIWNATDGKPERFIAGIFSQIAGLAWSPDGRYFASASYDHKIRIWRVGTNDSPEIVITFRRAAFSVAFSPDSAWLAATGGNEAIIAKIN
jgi:WD40 repeat protein